MNAIRTAARWIVAAAKWIALNKLALGGAASAVLAVVQGVADGADLTTVTLAVAGAVGVLSHLTVTPLARPRAADGTPLVPAVPAGAAAEPPVGEQVAP